MVVNMIPSKSFVQAFLVYKIRYSTCYYIMHSKKKRQGKYLLICPCCKIFLFTTQLYLEAVVSDFLLLHSNVPENTYLIIPISTLHFPVICSRLVATEYIL